MATRSRFFSKLAPSKPPSNASLFNQASYTTYTTNKRQLYILPTRIGWIFGLLILALLIAAIRFNHQATYLLTFALAAIGQVTSLYTHKNLLTLTLSARSHGNVFCNQPALFNATVKNPTQTQRNAVWLICGNHKTPLTIAANNRADIDVLVPTKHRGKLAIPTIILSSQFPIGILFSWTKAYQAQASCIVYPEPKKLLPFPDAIDSTASNHQQSNTINKKGSEELSHTRPYQHGDKPRDIHWQAYAKHQQLVSRELTSETTPKTVFNWQHVNNLNLEDKLSQLTQWIIEAEEIKTEYQLHIPGFKSSQSLGAEHMKDCLTSLALWREGTIDS